ncbi:DUF882 domain-containing protein [Edaphobacter aggregans]|uniref:DUF882 domain-containing protein n=1 Tax=Edaphobacter aggregans TaxID=570835 RepID=UPI000A06A0CB|nr:DUF882 domain-containing protein [Edaphobacter aggregans]
MTGIRLRVAAAVTAVALLGLSGVSRANDAANVAGAGEQYRLKLHHLHTGENIDVVYRVGDIYLPDAIAKLNYFLRDHRTQAENSYDPKEFDLLHALLEKLGRPNGEIDIVCGYRTPWSNSLLRSRSANSGVAQHSQHMLAKAIDIRVPGVATTTLRDAALSLHAGGVGYYPVNEFVHVDVGPVRQWQYGHAAGETRTVAKSTRRSPHHAASAVSGE